MSIYRFETTATMKPHNNKKWWIDADIVRPVKIEAADLKRLYNRWYKEENETFAEMRTAKKGKEYNEAQRRYIAAVSKLGAVQAVFAELGIEFDGLYEGV